MLPFLQEEDIRVCKELMEKTIQYVNRDDLEFNGVIYGGFFKCETGIKFIEFNARFGDPESLNILNTIDTSFKELFENVQKQTLNEKNCRFKKTNTFTLYVVTPNYAVASSKEPVEFELNKKKIEENGVKIYFSSTKQVEENKYISVGNSRLFAVVATDETMERAKERTYKALEGNISENLHYRKDIGIIYKH